MPKYKLDDGQTIVEAKDARELVRHMHKLSHAPAESDRVWMREAAERLVVQSGVEVRSDSETHFVQDLLAHAIILKVQ